MGAAFNRVPDDFRPDCAAGATGSPQGATMDAMSGYASPPELGDVVDALEDAAASLKAVVRNQTRTAVGEVDQFVRKQSLAALAIAAGIGYVVAGLTRWLDR